MCADVFRGGDCDAWFFLDGHSGAICAGMITGLCKSFRPSEQIRMVRRREAAAFFNIKKNDRLRRKTFPFGGGRSITRIVSSLLYRCIFVVQGPAFRATIQKQKAKSQRAQRFALPVPDPRVVLIAGRRTEPVTAEGERSSQYRKCLFARENIAVEAEIGGRCFLPR